MHEITVYVLHAQIFQAQVHANLHILWGMETVVPSPFISPSPDWIVATTPSFEHLQLRNDEELVPRYATFSNRFANPALDITPAIAKGSVQVTVSNL